MWENTHNLHLLGGGKGTLQTYWLFSEERKPLSVLTYRSTGGKKKAWRLQMKGLIVSISQG
jgi:hypothetical protein